MEKYLEAAYTYASMYGMKLIAAVAIFVIGKWLSGVISRVVENALNKSGVDKTLSLFAKNVAYAILVTVVILAAISKIGVQTTSFIALLGAAGLAIGMALQGSLANFAAGVMIIFFKPFKLGDFVVANGSMGTVKEIGIFTTILSAPDNVKTIVPNGQLISGEIKNFSANETRRVDLVIGVAYEADLKKVHKVLAETVAADPKVLKDPTTTIAVLELGDSSVNFVVRPWIKSSDYWDVYFRLTENIKLALDQNNISIPFPQRDIHVIGGNGSSSKESLAAAIKQQ